MPRRETLTFEDFKEHFLGHVDGGYYCVNSSFMEDDNGEFHKVVHMDMICEWRLDDGKVKFIAVPFETKDQFDIIVQFLKDCAKFLNKAIRKDIKDLGKDYTEHGFDQ